MKELMKKIFNTDFLMADPLKKYYLFVFLMSFNLFGAVLVPFFTEYGGITLFATQLIQSWFAFWVFALEVPTGVVADRYGRKASMFAGAVMFVIGFLVYGSYPSVWIFLLGEFILALAITLISGADQAWLYETLLQENRKDELTKVAGRAHTIRLIAMGSSAMLGGVVASFLPLNYNFLLSVIPAILGVFVVLSMKEPKATHTPKIRESAIKEIKNSIDFLHSTPQFFALVINLLLVSTSVYFVIWLYQPILTDLMVDYRYFGAFSTLNILFQVMVSMSFTKLETIFGGAKNYLRASALLVALGFLLVSIYPNIYTLVLFLFLSGGFGLTRIEFAFKNIQEILPEDNRAATGSTVSMYRRLAIAFANPVVGFFVTQNFYLTLFSLAFLPILAFLTSFYGVAKQDKK